jgi:hypothetical protein
MLLNHNFVTSPKSCSRRNASPEDPNQSINMACPHCRQTANRPC